MLTRSGCRETPGASRTRRALSLALCLAACSTGEGDTDSGFTTEGGSNNPSTADNSMSGPVQTNATQTGSDSDPSAGTDSSTESESATEGTSDASAGSSGTAATTGSTSEGSDASVDPTGGEQPVVVETTPESGAEGVDLLADISIVFSAPMKATSITTNTADESCTGSVQVSADEFVTCVQMTEAPAGSPDLMTFTVTPAALLGSVQTYKIRVTEDAISSADVPLAPYESPEGFLVRYYHAIALDGQNDFTGDETFTTSTDGFTGYVAWDKAYLYLGYAGSDLENNAPEQDTKWLLFYLEGAAGGAQGVQYNTQSPALPFAAQWHVRHRLDGNETSAREWSGGQWVDAGWDMSGDVDRSSGFVELRVALSAIEDPETLRVHVTMINEKGLAEWTWGAVPAGSLTDGYDPDYDGFYEFELRGSTVPADHAEMP